MMLTFQADYYDGLSSASTPVEVQVSAEGTLHVRGAELALRHDRNDVRIAARLGDTVRSLTFADGGKCETSDNEAVDRLAEAFGRGRGSHLVHVLESRYRIAIGALALLVALAAGGFVWGIPWAAKVIATRLPAEVVNQLGSGTLSMLERTVFERSELSSQEQQRLRSAFAEMADRYPELPLHLEFRHLGLPNAFALPDGTVVVTDGLVELADTDDEVLAVLAHELGHVHHRHGLRMAIESSSVGVIVAVLIGDVAELSSVLAALPAVYAQAAYSREHETEADAFALSYMRRTGQDPQHFADIMQKLQEAMGGESTGEGDPLQYLASHPPTRERIAKFAAAAKSAQ